MTFDDMYCEQCGVQVEVRGCCPHKERGQSVNLFDADPEFSQPQAAKMFDRVQNGAEDTSVMVFIGLTETQIVSEILSKCISYPSFGQIDKPSSIARTVIYG